VKATIARPAAACLGPRVTFDAIPLAVQTRPDLGRGPKDLYGALNSAANLSQDWTQAELAERLVCSVRSVIRWAHQLTAAGLLEIRRRGQGLPNLYVLLGPVVRSRSDNRARPQLPTWQPSARSTATPQNRPRRNNRDTTTNGSGYGDFPFGSRAAWVSRYGPIAPG
jgi:hypothetical protein